MTRSKSNIRVAVYDDFAPFSADGTGIDVDIARALAEPLGAKMTIAAFAAGADMSEDLRNMVWQGHCLRGAPADFMMHVPVDHYLIQRNKQVRVLAPYCSEQIAVVRSIDRVPILSGVNGFTRIRIGVEGGTLAHDDLLGALGGRFRESTIAFGSLADAVAALRAGEVAAVLGSRSQIEAALPEPRSRFTVSPFTDVGLSVREWDLGIAVRRQDEQLARTLERGVAQLHASGALGRIFRQHRVSWRPPKFSPGIWPGAGCASIPSPS